MCQPSLHRVFTCVNMWLFWLELTTYPEQYSKHKLKLTICLLQCRKELKELDELVEPPQNSLRIPILYLFAVVISQQSGP